jgi:tyrosyl-tRNA synthetase
VVADAPSSTLSRDELREGVEVTELLTHCGLAASKGEARRFIEQGGIYVNNVRIATEEPLTLANVLHDRYLVLRRGRRQMHLVVVA